MTKVAVGVRVKCDNKWATIKEVLPNGRFLVEWDGHGPGVVPWRESDFHFDQPNDPRAPLSPIRTETVTTRRLEPGVYGPLKVGAEISVPDCDRPDQPPEREIEAYFTTPYLNASDWRELARVALEIAEYLDAQ